MATLIDRLRDVQNKLIELNGTYGNLKSVEKVEQDGGLKTIETDLGQVRGRLASMGGHIPDDLKGTIGEKGEILFVFSIAGDVDIDINPKKTYILQIGSRVFEVVGKENYEYQGQVWGRSLFVKEIL